MALPKVIKIQLADLEAVELASRLRRRKVAHTYAMRAEIVLLAARGSPTEQLPNALALLV